MPSFLADLAKLLPDFQVRWNKFCAAHEGEASDLWRKKLDDDILCIDRDWREIAFNLFDFLLSDLNLSPVPDRAYRRRLDSILYPFQIYYGCIFLQSGDVQTKDSEPIEVAYGFEGFFAAELPWSADEIVESLAKEKALRKVVSQRSASIIRTSRSVLCRIFMQCLEKADEHDFARMLFICMNSPTRSPILKMHDSDLQHVMSIVQLLVDREVTNYRSLRLVLFDLVNRRGVLPDSIRISDGITWEASYSAFPHHISGGYADIFLGHLGGKKVALKRIRANRKDLFEAQLKVAIIWRQLRHRNVLPFIGVCDNLMTEVNLLVSPWMDNGDLSTFMKKYEEGGRYVDGIDFIRQIASGLEYLHSQDPQILHCDLRAGNIVVNEKLELLIIDFGVANYSQIKSQKMSDPNSAGTLHWMAPELFDPPPGSKATTGSSKSDVYAYAMTCFEIFSGTMPFSELPRPVAVMHQVLNGKRPRRPRGNADMRGLNDYVWSLIEACWSHETTKRPSMTDVLRSLDKMENHSVLIEPAMPPVLITDGLQDRDGDSEIPTSSLRRWISNLAVNIANFHTHFPSRSTSAWGDSGCSEHSDDSDTTQLDQTSELNVNNGVTQNFLAVPQPVRKLTYSEVTRRKGPQT